MTNKAELLLEIGCEEIPADQVLMAVSSIQKKLEAFFLEARLSFETSKIYATPRRLTVAFTEVQTKQEDIVSEVSGPPAKAAYRDGVPTKAAEGFARGLGLTVDDLTVKETPKGEYVFATKQERGRPTKDLLPDAIIQALSKIPFKKVMRWGHVSTPFIRPIQWITCVLGGELVPFEFADVRAGSISYGHRFLSPEAFQVSSETEYVTELRQRHVLADVAERRELIVKQATELAATVGGKLRDDDELLDEVAQLVEKPFGMLCDFDSKYLDIPQEVLISEMQEHQRYLPLIDEAGKLLPNFIVIGNMDVTNPAVVKDGYQRVLTARFSDGVFFFEEDKKKSLESRVDALKKVQYHRALGSIYEKVERIQKLAQNLNEALGDIADAERLSRAALLCKTDLVTNMVFEFPELQGIMGHAYAVHDGEADDVALAIEEHYMPRNAQDDLPSADLGALVGLADRLDTLVGIFATGKGPTGAADPYGLRRAVIAIINILKARDWHLSFGQMTTIALDLLEDRLKKKSKSDVFNEVTEFFEGRLRGLLTSQGLPKDVVDAVIAARSTEPSDVEARATALAGLKSSADFEPISVAFKRVSNILKGKSFEKGDMELLTSDAELALIQSVADATEQVAKHAESRKFDEAFSVLATLRPTVDTFFDQVMVMDEDINVRNARLTLLGKLGDIFRPLADFTRLN
ncbi:MAG: glycine--tRNA ligase subunit beta [Myxococcota bacterium]|nr:glycine--tRNA ligase subunit beta [Myxococcota bacterium]